MTKFLTVLRLLGDVIVFLLAMILPGFVTLCTLLVFEHLDRKRTNEELDEYDIDKDDDFDKEPF